MAHTLFLDAQWDLTLDAGGNIATVTGPYAVAQNVANAVRLFTNDAYFDANRGIPHFDIELGHVPPYSILRTRILEAARAVEGVSDATVTFDDPVDRVLGGEISLTLTTGETVNVTF